MPTPAAATPTPFALPPQSEQSKKKRACPDKKEDFLGINTEESVKEVLEALPSKTIVVAVVHSKYWIKEWRDNTTSCTTKDLVVAISTSIARALSTSIQLEGLVKDNGRRTSTWRLEKNLHYGDTEAKMSKANKMRLEAEGQCWCRVAEEWALWDRMLGGYSDQTNWPHQWAP